jgi:hypothetical protein
VLSFNEHSRTGFDCASGIPLRASAPYKFNKTISIKTMETGFQARKSEYIVLIILKSNAQHKNSMDIGYNDCPVP